MDGFSLSRVAEDPVVVSADPVARLSSSDGKVESWRKGVEQHLNAKAPAASGRIEKCRQDAITAARVLKEAEALSGSTSKVEVSNEYILGKGATGTTVIMKNREGLAVVTQTAPEIENAVKSIETGICEPEKVNKKGKQKG